MQEMSVIKYGRKWDKRRHHSETVADTVTSTPVRVPAGSESVLATVVPGTSADVEFTNDDYDTVDAGSADWFPWSPGSASSKTSAEIPSGATAVRCTSSGSSKFTVTA